MADTGDNMIVLGLMSGTSLDGLDLAICSFGLDGENISCKLLAAKTVEYTPAWKEKLSAIKDARAENYFHLHALYGKYLAEEITIFVKDSGIKPDCVASHGHTIFHQPKAGFSTQIGCGATIAAHTQLTTICDFRSLDVSLSGQGAPLVPIGDKLLFGNYSSCLNIGGIANISFDKKGKRVAYDVCEANMLLNLLAERSGKPFDRDGNMARTGKIQSGLLQKLNSLDYYSEEGAKSIGREWFETHIEILLDPKINVNDLLATSTEHVAEIIAGELNKHHLKNVLVTGGGAFNKLLIEKIISKTASEIILPEEDIINYKEALIFAFLSYMRMLNKTNTLSSVTGAIRDSVGGAVYLP